MENARLASLTMERLKMWYLNPKNIAIIILFISFIGILGLLGYYQSHSKILEIAIKEKDQIIQTQDIKIKNYKDNMDGIKQQAEQMKQISVNTRKIQNKIDKLNIISNACGGDKHEDFKFQYNSLVDDYNNRMLSGSQNLPTN